MKRYFLILFLLIPFSALSQKSLLTAPYSYRLVAHAFSKESRFGNQWSVIIGAGGMVKINDVFFIGAEYDYIIPMIEVPSPPMWDRNIYMEDIMEAILVLFSLEITYSIS